MNIDNVLLSEIIKVLNRFGITQRTYFVGGSVRDFYRDDCKPHDYDLVVEKITTKEIREMKMTLNECGKDFPVFKFLCKDSNGNDHEIDLAVARIERSTGKGHSDFEVEFGEHISIYDDLHRRDLTINAMAVPITNLDILIDPYGGLKDLDNKILRHTSFAFTEDPLRVFRLARFAVKFADFKIEDDTLEIAKSIREDTKELPGERIFMELEKLFELPNPSKFFRVLRQCNNLDVWFPELHKMINLIQPQQYHGGKDVFDHTMETIDNASLLNEASVKVLFGALTHDFGKILTPKDILPHHYDHDDIEMDIVDDFCRRIKIPNIVKKVIVDSIKYHMRIHTTKKYRKLVKMVGSLHRNGTFDEVINVAMADRCERGFDHEKINKLKVLKSVFSLNLPPEIVDELHEISDNEEKKFFVENYRIKLFRDKLREIKNEIS